MSAPFSINTKLLSGTAPFRFRAIPFSIVADSIFNQETPLSSTQRPRNSELNTSQHTHAEISSALPSCTINHVFPDYRNEHLSNWLPPITASQGIKRYYTLHLSRRCIISLLDARKVWISSDRGLSESLLEDLLDVSPKTALATTISTPPRPEDDDSTPQLLKSSNSIDLATLLSTNNVFLRLDSCSTKDSPTASSLPRSATDLITRLVTSARASSSLQAILNPVAVLPSPPPPSSSSSGASTHRSPHIIPLETRASTSPTATADCSARLYLVPFRPELDPAYEYRVFWPPVSGVSPGGIAAISQYRWHTPWKGGKESEESAEETVRRVYAGAEKLRKEIVRYAERLKAEAEMEMEMEMEMESAEENGRGKREVEGEGEKGEEGKEGKARVLEKLRTEGWVFDVFDAKGAGVDTGTGEGEVEGKGDEVQLVEANPFGAMSGCGSGLFHWIGDAEVLYGVKGEDCEFRVAVDDEEMRGRFQRDE